MGTVTHTVMFSTGPACLLLVGAVSSLPLPDGPGPHHPEGPLPIPRPGADGSYAGDAHFQYINVPAPGNFEWGYRRGNPDHNREEYLSQKDHTFKAKLKWHDGYGGHGEHYYDINHVGPKEHAAPAYHAPKPAYGAGSENVASYVPAPAAPAARQWSLIFPYYHV